MAPQISLPRGGGAIHGIGEKFSANPVTGTGSLSVPIATSPGRSGFGPQLSLSYDSGSGNGPFGLGWSLSLPEITRRTDKGLPRYFDDEESDIFILSGAEDLVPVLDSANDWAALTIHPRNGYAIKQYRPRIEGLFARIERWTRQSDGDTYWRSISRDNVTTFYGRTVESRIADPADPTRVFSWLISQGQDDKGNVVVYGYAAENSDNVDLTQANERNRSWSNARSANRYLSSVKYGNTQSLLNTSPSAASTSSTATPPWLFEVAFDYGEGYFTAAAPDAQGRVFASATLSPTGKWPVRQDPFSHYRACFDVRTYRLCRRVLMFHHFGTELATPDCLVRTTEFAYQENPTATVMTGVTQSGYALPVEGQYLQASLPPLQFEYSQARVQKQVREVDPASLANLPAGIDGSRFRWLDLDGEGLQCVLAEQDDAWFYKRNLSPLSLSIDSGLTEPVALFEDLSEVMRLPALAQARAPHHQFMDLVGDGHLDCVVLERPGAGFYERNAGERWQSFTSLNSAPNIDWNDPNLRLIDVDGDGFSDVLITAEDSLTYYPSCARFGFGAPIRLPKAMNEEAGPAIIFADSERSIFLADMSGDGLSDIVRIRNGEICYWPNLGYGQFGAKVTMDAAPWLDAPDQFDPARIRLADIDGSGVTDLVYLAGDGVRIYFNQSGNAWTVPDQVMDYPPIQQLASIQALDLLGNGTACLVWTSSDPSDAGRSIRYIDMMGRDKPYLMVRSRNNLGAETRVSYAPSTAFYLADRAQGKPWATRLPFPVHVVERVETYDWISRNLFVTRYAYHHGYYDGTEREFRGFGMVEQRDTEELGVLTQSGAFPTATNLDAASYVPPVLTRTWFHTGAYPLGPHVTRIYDDEYWSETGLHDAAFVATLLPDSPLSADLTGEEIREALRSLKGAMLHQEVYALDSSDGTPGKPYSVSERNYTITLLQPFGYNRHAVFLTHARESLDLHYERTTYQVSGNAVYDPRTAHSFVLEVDEFANELKSASIGYGRRHQDTDLLMTPADNGVQLTTLITYTESAYTNAILGDDDDYRTSLPAETRTYQLTGYTASGSSGRFQSSDFVTLVANVLQPVFDSEIPYEAQPTTGRQRRLIEQVRTLYRRDDLTGALPFLPPQPLISLQSLGLPFCSYKLALTPGIISSVYLRPQAGQAPEPLVPNPAAVLKGAKGGYVLSDDQIAAGLFPSTDPSGYWWVPTGQVFYSPGSADSPATELSTAQSNFFLGRRYRDIFGADTIVKFDQYDLLPAQVTDPVGNFVTASSDYRVLQPKTMTDPNGNQSAVAFDALGLVVGTAVMDKSVTAPQDSIVGFTADLLQSQIDQFFADPRGPIAASLLGNATSRIVYDVGGFARAPSAPQAPAPNFAATIMREIHVQNLGSNQASPLQVGVSFSDGFGREIQKKTQADPGPLVLPDGPVSKTRWIGSGWTIWNNKGKPVRKYERFFTATHDFEYGAAVGVSSTLFYDPLSRVVATLHPDQSWEKVTFDPWRQCSWDGNDTVLIADPSADNDVGVYFKPLPPADYKPTWYAQRINLPAGDELRDAAEKAAVHTNTPATVHFDSLGRSFLTFAYNRSLSSSGAPVEGHYRTFVAFDIEGNQLAISDALQRVIMTYDYDMLGAKLHQDSVDAGQRWSLNDATGKPYLGWDSRDHNLEHDYDVARRPIALLVATGGAQAVLAEKTVYGEGQLDAASLNLLGKPYQQYDAAGIVINAAYDFKGNLLNSTREIFNSAAGEIADYTNPIDWSGPLPATLSGETFTASSTFDALNRPVTLTSPNGSVTRPTYDQAGILVQVAVNLQGSATATSFVTNIEYDAKGQRSLIQLGNGAKTAYIYDPNTFRLTSLTTTRSSDSAILQALSYSYDPVGNITHIEDSAQETVFFANQIIPPDNDYVYDAIYRLIQATGREAIGLVSAPQTTWDDSARMGQALPLPSDAQALRVYTETYAYDSVGNFVSLVHGAANGNWTRTYAYDAPNQPPTNNRLTSTTIGATTETYSYDAHGNMLTMPHLPLMAWDFKDQLQETETRVDKNSPVETTTYVYDASGQRVRKIVGTASGGIAYERTYLGGFELYREYGAGGPATTLERQTLHVMDDKQRVAMVETLTKGEDRSARQLIRYQFANHLGSACLELDETSAILSYEEYYPYGSTSYQALNASIKVTAKRYRYTGMERDEETGFNYHSARYYAPWLGTWTKCDPAGLVDGLDLYVYTANNPVRMIDPNGTDPINPSNPQGTPNIVPQSEEFIHSNWRELGLAYDPTIQRAASQPSGRAPPPSAEEPMEEVFVRGIRPARGSSNASPTDTSATDDRSFWSRGGVGLALGTFATVLGAAMIFSNPVGWGVALAAAMLFAGGVAATSTSAVELGASYGGKTTKGQDAATNKAVGTVLSLSSPGGLIGGTTGMMLGGEKGMESGALYGGLAEGVVSLGSGIYRLRPGPGLVPEPVGEATLAQWRAMDTAQRRTYEVGQMALKTPEYLSRQSLSPMQRGRDLMQSGVGGFLGKLNPGKLPGLLRTGPTAGASYVAPSFMDALHLTLDPTLFVHVQYQTFQTSN
jgi:RHS repeat-associated protein